MPKVPTSINIDRDLRNQATDIFEELGISFSQAVTIFCRAVVRENGLPFAMTIDRQASRPAAAGQAPADESPTPEPTGTDERS